jgi:uncharacterized protein (TIGR01777 family)
MNQERIIIAGGSGFIGSALAAEFAARGREVFILTRHPHERGNGVREILWDGQHPGEWMKFLDGAEAVINLAGKTINCRHTPQNLREIIVSRVNSVNAVGAAVAQLQTPPHVWVQAGAIGFYGDTKDTVCDESAPNGIGTLAKLCRDWEGAFEAVPTPKTRRVLLRIGFVLGRESGAFPVLSRLTNYFLGGAVGNGRQYISWIHLADLVKMFVAAVEDKRLSGIYNAVAPEPVTNAAFMRALRQACHRPWSPPAPKLAVKFGALLMKTDPSLALVSQRCVPKRFLNTGFRYHYAELAGALRDLCRNT